MKTHLFKYKEKTENFQIKKLIHYFSYFCSKNRLWVLARIAPLQGSSDEYPQSIFLSRNKKNNVNSLFYYKTVGYKWVRIIQACFCDGSESVIGFCLACIAV